MAKIDDWKKTAPHTLKIDWAAVEKNLSFALHDNLKDFYSRITAKKVEGTMRYDPHEFVKEYVNKEDWLEDSNGKFPNCQFELWVPENTETDYVCRFFQDAFFGDWTGGNDLGRRALIGQLFINIGQLYMIFNNDTGRFEWCDIEYGYYDVYEENPYGIIADNAQEFLDKFKN